MRYSRHHALHNFGKDRQEILHTKKAIIIGCGGLGCSAALNLVGSGIGTLGLMDKDTVCISNLHRQHGHTTQTLGMSKVESLQQSCNNTNPDVEIQVYNQWFDLNPTTIQIINTYDIILDCSDNATTRININRVCRKLKKPLIFASSIGWDGQVFSVTPNGPCLECVFPGMKQTKDTCESRGVFGPVPGIMGSIQAIEAIKYLVGINLSQKLIMYDSFNSSIHEIHTETNPDCLVCGNNNFISAVSCIKDYSEYLKDINDKKVLLDIRKEFSQDHEILNAIQITKDEITREYLETLSKKHIYVLCDYGEHSVELVQKIRNMGFVNTWSINGGSRKVFS